MFITALLIVAAYMAVRFFIYHIFPAPSLEAWFYRDCWMTVPRLLALGVLVLVGRIFKMPYSWTRSRDRLIPWIGGLCLIGAVFLEMVSRKPVFLHAMPYAFIGIGALTSLVVGLFEEYAFRGAIFGGLSRRLPLGMAAIFSSVLFTVYHWQAQSLVGWIWIFLVSLVFCGMRAKGAGLLALGLVHGAVDWLYFIWVPQQFDLFHPFYLGSLLWLFVLVFLFSPPGSKLDSK